METLTYVFFLNQMGWLWGGSFYDWPSAAADDHCEAAFQARVTHRGAARIIAPKLGPDPQAARAGCPGWRMHHDVLRLCSCGSAGSMEILAWRTGGRGGVLTAWADTNRRSYVSTAASTTAQQPSTPELECRFQWQSSTSELSKWDQDNDFWQSFRPKLPWRSSSSRELLQSKLGWRSLASRSTNLGLWGQFQSKLGWRCLASRTANPDLWPLL